MFYVRDKRTGGVMRLSALPFIGPDSPFEDVTDSFEPGVRKRKPPRNAGVLPVPETPNNEELTAGVFSHGEDGS